MKQPLILSICIAEFTLSNGYAQNKTADSSKNHLYMDVHYLPAGTVKFSEVAGAHVKDLATEGKYGVRFLKYWVDESKGVIYCLSSAPDTSAIRTTHGEAHGLLPQVIYKVEDGDEALSVSNKTYFLDIHELGADKVTAAEVEKAHQKDLAVQHKYGVNFVNYWVDENTGAVLCLSQASDPSKVIQAHKEAHGLVPVSIKAVKQGQ